MQIKPRKAKTSLSSNILSSSKKMPHAHPTIREIGVWFVFFCKTPSPAIRLVGVVLLCGGVRFFYSFFFFVPNYLGEEQPGYSGDLLITDIDKEIFK